MKKALIIGYGSIGKKHFNFLKSLNIFEKISISSKHLPKNNNNLTSIQSIINYQPDYVVIANTSNLHFKTLKIINEKLKNIKIYIEKPLFLNLQKIPIKNKNEVVVGYNLRQHKGFSFIKNYLQNNKIISAEIKCTSFLPNWRKQNYIKTSTAKKNLSGGIIYELSHELDYANFLFKKLKPLNCELKKLSNLTIDGNDFFHGKFKSAKCNNIYITMNYFDRAPQRYIKIIAHKSSIKFDLLSG